MAMIDSSIYFQQKTADPMGSFSEGMKMGDMIRQRREEKQLQDAYKAGIIQNPDGTVTQDGAKTMSALINLGRSDKAWELQDQLNQRKQAEAKIKKEKQQADLEEVTRSAWKVNDQNSYDTELKNLSSKGIDISQLPKQYNQQMIDQVRRQTLTVKERLDEIDKQAKLKLDQERLDIDRTKANNAKKSGDNLPIEAKKTIETLASKNANKISIKNQIDAVINSWDAMPEDQKIAAGRQLLKTLNSTEGADAIGAEEANRLGSKLEYALGNFTNSNPTQWGRDLEGFKTQAMNTSKSIGDAIEANKGHIDSAYGRQSPKAPLKKPKDIAQNKAPILKGSQIEWAD